MTKQQKERLQALVGRKIQWNCPLKEYTSFGIGGPVEALVKVENSLELQKILYFFKEENISWRVIGRGTNILVKDKGVKGAALILSGEFKQVTFNEQERSVLVTAGAGYSLSKLSSKCMEQGYSGLEFAIGIPGSVGGAVIMNAGAWGGEIADNLLDIELQTAGGKLLHRKEELHFGYRSLTISIDEPFAISLAKFLLQKKEHEEMRVLCKNYLEKRKKAQPSGYGNAGSFFKNPQGDSAGRLIDASGLKGVNVGDAEISTKHANFIINRGSASADDIVELMKIVIDTVFRDSGIRLEPEVQIW